MVGETQARKFAKNNEELLEVFNVRRLKAKQKVNDIKKMVLELERDLAAEEREEALWDAAIFELENVGVQSGPKRRKRGKDEDEEEEEGEERD